MGRKKVELLAPAPKPMPVTLSSPACRLALTSRQIPIQPLRLSQKPLLQACPATLASVWLCVHHSVSAGHCCTESVLLTEAPPQSVPQWLCPELTPLSSTALQGQGQLRLLSEWSQEPGSSFRGWQREGGAVLLQEPPARNESRRLCCRGWHWERLGTPFLGSGSYRQQLVS